MATGNRLSRQAHLRPIFDMPANRFGLALLLRLKIVSKKEKKRGGLGLFELERTTTQNFS